MRRSVLMGAFAAAISMATLAAPVLAHGEGDARALARNVVAGPYTFSLWQVDGNSATAMTPHVIVMFDGVVPTAGVALAVNASPVEVHLSTTTAHAWETTQGVSDGEQLTVTISEGGHVWSVGPVVVQPLQAPIPFMKEVILASILVTARVIWWAARRTARVWRRPVVGPAGQAATKLSEGVTR